MVVKEALVMSLNGLARRLETGIQGKAVLSEKTGDA